MPRLRTALRRDLRQGRDVHRSATRRSESGGDRPRPIRLLRAVLSAGEGAGRRERITWSKAMKLYDPSPTLERILRLRLNDRLADRTPEIRITHAVTMGNLDRESGATVSYAVAMTVGGLPVDIDVFVTIDAAELEALRKSPTAARVLEDRLVAAIIARAAELAGVVA